jgi:tRNA1(Val) A37 N6-methylase TrmN6
MKSPQVIKAKGIHYTPDELAAFLADVTWGQSASKGKTIEVLDPACGDGGLLRAIAQAAPSTARRKMRLIGFETDPAAIENARENLAGLKVAGVELRSEDFLEAVTRAPEQVDIVISNPPYVRTQVLGARESQRLAALFGLRGRVDLYHAFVKAMSLILRPGGTLGLLTSNRFMVTQAGASVRTLLRKDFDLRQIYDLGDTKFFEAAVLPAIVVARRSGEGAAAACSFTRVYETRRSGKAGVVKSSVVEALKKSRAGLIRTDDGVFHIEQGELSGGPPESAWSLSSPESRGWLEALRSAQSGTFEDVAQVRVGIKTTCDSVFIREDWDELPEAIRPEEELLRPLITHHTSARWFREKNDRKAVLYPHEEGPDGEKRPVELRKFPRAKAYLEKHRAKLTARRYVLEAGRQWYEIWVPQQPGEWALEKLVYPDISEHPRFFLDRSSAVVNGDCYWITLNKDARPEWMYLLLAVANSTLATTFYDTVFHNKLYSGRRRFMTQYVRQFPLPRLEAKESRRIIELLSGAKGAVNADRDAELDALVWAGFKLRKEVHG